MQSPTTPIQQQPVACGITDSSDWATGRPAAVAGCLVMLGRAGRLDLTVNSRSFTLTPGRMAFLVFDMITLPTYVSDDFEAFCHCVDFPTAQDLFFLITSNRFWDYVYSSPVFRLPGHLAEAVQRWFDTNMWIMRHCSPAASSRPLRNETENMLLIMAETIEVRLGAIGDAPSKNRAWAIANEFLVLVNRHYSRHHDVAFYAARLNITPNYLNIIIRRHLGVSAKEQLTSQLCRAMKMLLDTTDLTVKQIAARLHFDDPSHLCRVFRRQTGLSPVEYRNRRDGSI